MKTSNCRIKESYRARLEEIARLYVEAGGNMSAAAREVRKLPDCASFKPDFFRRWAKNPEFAAFVKESEDGRANALRLRPSVRGPQRIAWLLEVETELKSRMEGVEKDAEKDKTLRSLLAVGQDIRDEERHYEDQQQKAARRDFGKLVRNLIAYVKARHGKVFVVVAPVLKDALQNFDRIAAGRAADGQGEGG